MERIQVLGPGCPQCDQLCANAAAAAAELGIDVAIEKITDIDHILAFDVLMTPALAFDGHVQAVGKVLSVAEIRGLLEYALGQERGPAREHGTDLPW